MKNERVICVKRCCCSLTGVFPSGILTIFTWIGAGLAVRHEYTIVYTTNYVILIEISKNTGSGGGYITKIKIRKSSENDRYKTENEMTKDK